MKFKKYTFLLLLVVICVMLSHVFSLNTVTYAYDSTPDNFGEKVGDTVDDGEYLYINYEYGYRIYNLSDTPLSDGSNAIAHIGGKCVEIIEGQAVESRISLEKMLEIVAISAQDTTYQDEVALAAAYGPLWDEGGLSRVIEKIREEYTDLYNRGYTAGIPSSEGVSSWESIMLKEDYYYGDGADNTDGGRVTTIAYSRTMDRAFSVTDEIWEVWSEAYYHLGAPITNQGDYILSHAFGEYAEFTSDTYVSQVFEKGFIYYNDLGNAVYVVGAIKKVDDNEYIIYPFIKDNDIMDKHLDDYVLIGDIDEIWHPIKSAIVIDNDDDTATLYVNYAVGCVKVTYDMINGEILVIEASKTPAMRYAGYNYLLIDGEIIKEVLPLRVFNHDEFLWVGEDYDYDGVVFECLEVTPTAISMYQVSQPDGDEESLKQIFRNAFNELYEDGFIAGYRSSAIKVWDLVVLDFKYGDSFYGFDSIGSGKRERMTALVYSPTKNRAFAVYDEYWNIFREDYGIGRKSMGAPITKVMEDIEINGINYLEIQCYENAYVYKTESGRYVVEVGYRWNEELNVFELTTAPAVHGKYGAKVNEIEIDGVVYINYQNGAVKATLNAFSNAYLYDYYPGRNFNENYETYLLPMSNFITLDTLEERLGGNQDMRNKFNDSIKLKIYNKYKEIYDSGFFPGFIEQEFHGGWNSVYAQQLIIGDSTADPFRQRPNVSAIIYNPDLDEVFFLTNAMLDVWNSNFIQLKFPTSDAYVIDGITFQDFKGNLFNRTAIAIAVEGSQAFFYNNGTTAQEYLNTIKQHEIPSHRNNPRFGYIGEGGTDIVMTVVYIAIGVVGAAIIATGTVLIIKKRKLS